LIYECLMGCECYLSFFFIEKYISLFILYSIIHVICPKNNQISVAAICRTAIRYPTFGVGRYAPLSEIDYDAGNTNISLFNLLVFVGKAISFYFLQQG